MKNYIDQDDMISANSAYVLQTVRRHAGISRKEISSLTGLSWGGMTKIVNRLLESGYITEEKGNAAPGVTRVPNLIKVNPEKNFVVGLDFNLAGFHAVVTDLTGRILTETSSPAPKTNTQALLASCTDFLVWTLSPFAPEKLFALGVAMQGIVDVRGGISLKLPGISDWSNIPLRDILEERFRIRTWLEHDPDCLLFPHLQKAGKDNLLLLRIDRSIGAAVSVNGKLLKDTGILEIAHNIVVPGGKPCTCGMNGCLEAYIAPCLMEDNVDENALRELCDPLAITIRNLSGVFRADRVILTGALIGYLSQAEAQLRGFLDDYCPSLPVELLELSTSADVGAASIAADLAIKELKI
ncbi:MAG: ROK family transcriptional regulator [Oscillospiraceae bacterium]|nr:ROK family transcriptional regulator [Oscillospiraceae bacterium]